MPKLTRRTAMIATLAGLALPRSLAMAADFEFQEAPMKA